MMKTIGKLLWALLIASRLALGTPAQNEQPTRDVVKAYQGGQSNGVKVAVMLNHDGSPTPADPAQEFKTGDSIKVALESNFSGYVYVVNYGSSGTKRLLFPDARERNLAQPGRKYLLPVSYDLRIDEPVGTEVIKVFLSRQRIGFLDPASKRPGGVLRAREVAALEQLWQHSDSQKPGLMVESVNPHAACGAESRDPVWDTKNKNAYILLQKQKGQSGKLGNNRIAAFRINLKNGGAKK